MVVFSVMNVLGIVGNVVNVVLMFDLLFDFGKG